MLPLNLVKNFLKDLKREITLTVFASKELYEFAKEISEVNSQIRCVFVDYPEDRLKLPAIKLDKSLIFFHGLPQHSELQSFLFALKLIAEDVKVCSDADLVVITFTSPFCPNCQATVDAINRLSQKYCLEHHIVDVNMFPEFASSFEITSVPTVILDEMVFKGAMKEDELEKWIKLAINKDYYEYLADKLVNGEIEEVIKFADKENIGKELGKLMAHREFMVRLGAMAALEALQEKTEIVEEARKEIIELLQHEDERIREDAAMMLGIIGKEKDIKNLNELIEEGGRVGDSAKEAIRDIRKRRRENG